MSRTYDHETTIAQHIASLTKAVIDGDADALAVIDAAMQEWSAADWTALTTRSAAGVNHMQEFIDKTIEAEAEKRAAAGRAPLNTRRSRVIEHRAELAAWRDLCAMEPGYT